MAFDALKNSIKKRMAKKATAAPQKKAAPAKQSGGLLGKAKKAIKGRDKQIQEALKKSGV